jgi:hypothetical protein
MDRIVKLSKGLFFTNTTGKPSELPAIVFKLNPNDAAGIKIANDYAVVSEYTQTHQFLFEFDEYRTDRHLVVHVLGGYHAEFQGELNVSNINEFVSEHNHEILGKWNLRSIRGLKRRFAAVFASTPTDVRMFKEAALTHQETFAWGSTVIHEVTDPLALLFRIEDGTLPCIVVVDPIKSRYAKLANISTFEDVDEFLEPFETGVPEEYLRFEPFNRTVTRKSRFTKENVMASLQSPTFYDELRYGFSIVLGPVAIVVALLVALIICFEVVRRFRAKPHVKTD